MHLRDVGRKELAIADLLKRAPFVTLLLISSQYQRADGGAVVPTPGL